MTTRQLTRQAANSGFPGKVKEIATFPVPSGASIPVAEAGLENADGGDGGWFGS